MLEIATDYVGTVCKPYHNTRSAIGTQDGSGVVNATYRLVSAQSGHCLDVAGDSRVPGGNIQQWTCNGTPAQDWRIVNVGRGYYKLISRASGHCMNVAGGSTAPGANVAQWYCNNLQPQIWRFERR